LITIGIQVLTFGLMAEMFTAVTYRRSNVMELIRQVNRPSITENSDSDG
jgi:hypothetical protein